MGERGERTRDNSYLISSRHWITSIATLPQILPFFNLYHKTGLNGRIRGFFFSTVRIRSPVFLRPKISLLRPLIAHIQLKIGTQHALPHLMGARNEILLHENGVKRSNKKNDNVQNKNRHPVFL